MEQIAKHIEAIEGVISSYNEALDTHIFDEGSDQQERNAAEANVLAALTGIEAFKAAFAPGVTPMLDVSTGHLKQSTRAFLEQKTADHYTLVVATDNGWFTAVPLIEDDGDRSEVIARYPEDLVKVWDYARSIGVGYVLIDSDAPYLEALPIYPDDPAENGAPITDPYEAAARAAGWGIRGDTFVHDNGDIAHDDLGTISPQADDAWKLVCQLGGIDINDRRAK